MLTLDCYNGQHTYYQLYLVKVPFKLTGMIKFQSTLNLEITTYSVQEKVGSLYIVQLLLTYINKLEFLKALTFYKLCLTKPKIQTRSGKGDINGNALRIPCL